MFPSLHLPQIMASDNTTIVTLTQRSPSAASTVALDQLCLTAEERTRSRHRFHTQAGQEVLLQLPRGTILQAGDVLHAADGAAIAQVIAKSEPVLTVTAPSELDLLRAAYHLGNRHVPLEITANYLRLSPDSVLRSLLEHLGLSIHEESLPFYPEAGAYTSGHHAKPITK
jgi:urease accessory protein